MPITVDLLSRKIDPDDKIYVIRPGRAYSFYQDFARQKKVFLDLPGLDYPHQSPPSQQTMARILLRSARVRSWHLQGADSDNVPNRDIRTYTVSDVPKSRVQLAGAFRALHFVAPRGSIILVPGPGYFSDVYVGEVSDDLTSETTTTIPAYGNDRIPARSVNWLAQIPKWNFTPEMIKQLQLRSPLVTLGADFHDELIKLSFPNYSYGNVISSQLVTTKAEFTSQDDLNIQLFIIHVAGIIAGLEAGESVRTLESASDILDRMPEFVPELTLDIASPGKISLLSERIVPLVISALMTAALAQSANAAKPVVTAVNSLNPTDPCLPPVNQRLTQALEKFAGDDWNAHCKRLQKSNTRSGIHPKTHLVNSTTKGASL